MKGIYPIFGLAPEARINMKTSEVPSRDFERAYIQFRPVLLRAMAGLARRGLAVPVADGLDLIHDFFTNEWTSINANFDPEKGVFDAYIYGAFVRFARPRILKLRRWQNSLVDPESLGSIHSPDNVEDQMAFTLDTEFLDSSIRNLPPIEKALLTAYLYSKEGSLRSVAKQFALSRYRVRDLLIQALGRLATSFPKPLDIAQGDWDIARSVWGERRTLDETAALFEMPLHRVKNSVRRASAAIAERLQQLHLQFGENTMSASNQSFSAAELLRKVLSSPDNEELLQEVRVRSQEILALIESEDVAIGPEKQNELWIARVYEALSPEPEASLSAELTSMEEALFATEQHNLGAIGKAFKETLLPDLPEELVRFGSYFANAVRISGEEVELLSKEPDVAAAFPNSTDLALFGLRPLTVFYASEAVGALLDRLLRYGMIESSDLFLSGRQGNNYAPLISRRNPEISFPEEIRLVVDCRIETCRLLLRWLLAVAEYKPCVIGGFEAEPKHNGVILKPAAHHFNSLYERWALSYSLK